MAEQTANQRYYAKHRDVEKARSASYRADDPDGTKKERARIASLKGQYKRNPTLKRAMSWYLAQGGDPNTTLAAIKTWAQVNSSISVIENATGGAARRRTVRAERAIPATVMVTERSQ
jgi:hypothetical protein